MMLSEFIKQEADWLFNEEVGHVETEDFDAVYETITRDFRLGAIAMASRMKDVFELLELKGDPNAIAVVKYLNAFMVEEVKEIEDGRRYL